MAFHRRLPEVEKKNQKREREEGVVVPLGGRICDRCPALDGKFEALPRLVRRGAATVERLENRTCEI